MEAKGLTDTPPSVAVIGAGIAGIACAQALASNGICTTVFEKSRSFGGRCATRLWRECIVDHGAQYFTASHPDFSHAIHQVCGTDLASITQSVLDPQGRPLSLENRPRYYHIKGNNRLAKSLAEGLDIRREHTATKLTKVSQGWRLDFDQAPPHTANVVVLTCPWPQTANLLGLDANSAYEPCLTGFFAFQGTAAGNSADCYARMGDKEGVLAWSACENHKTGRITGDSSVFVVQSGPSFSREHLESPADVWLNLQRAALQEAWDLDPSSFQECFGHRWRYARNLAPTPAPELPDGLLLAGDSEVASRIEDAWFSGRDCAMQIINSSPSF